MMFFICINIFTGFSESLWVGKETNTNVYKFLMSYSRLPSKYS